mmetsp:Transcript_12255/g.29199  ORF Transcript_12255/g.29199 Transcript_12255/m.29199 type:complete len:100 (+) Transcript_12255:842-1141(+)
MRQWQNSQSYGELRNLELFDHYVQIVLTIDNLVAFVAVVGAQAAVGKILLMQKSEWIFFWSLDSIAKQKSLRYSKRGPPSKIEAVLLLFSLYCKYYTVA